MPLISTTRRARIQSQITALEAQLTAINESITTSAGQGVQEYDWQDGGGRQQVKRVKIKDLYATAERIQSQLERLYRILDGTGNPKINIKTY